MARGQCTTYKTGGTMQKVKRYGIEIVKYSMQERFTMAWNIITQGGFTSDYTLTQLCREQTK